MVSRWPRAQLFQGGLQPNVLYVVYDTNVRQSKVLPVVRQMSALRGIQARARRGSMDDPHGPKRTFIELTIQQSADVSRAMATLRRLTNPELPIAISLIRVDLWICRPCGYLSTGLGALGFYPGLGPDDDEAFNLRYHAAMQKLPVAQLFSDFPRPPYKLLTDGVEEVLAQLRARATMVSIVPRDDPRPCDHSK